MTHAEAPAHEPAAAHGHPHVPEVNADHHDPLHDIDGKSTALAVVGSLALIVGLIWAMTHLFNLMVQVERKQKIADAPATELLETRAEMDQELAGKLEERGTLSIEQAKAEYLRNPAWRLKEK